MEQGERHREGRIVKMPGFRRCGVARLCICVTMRLLNILMGRKRYKYDAVETVPNGMQARYAFSGLDSGSNPEWRSP